MQTVLEQLDSVAALRAAALAWDRLWERSETSLPTARAELVAQWVEHFAADNAFRALVVHQDGELVAAVPLVCRRLGGTIRVGDLTWNYWSPNGELLLDPSADAEAALDLLAGALDDGPWPLLWLEMVPIETPRWQALLAALARRGLPVDVHCRYQIGQAEIAGSFHDYEAGRSRNLRHSMRKAMRRLECGGPVQLKVHSRIAPEEVEPLLREAFEIERRSWKEEGGNAILGTTGVFDFYLRQARQLAAWGALRLAFLCLNSRPIAFELGWTAKGVYHSYKVGYDAAYRVASPGHVLRKLLIEFLFERPDVRLVDFQGPISEALAAWSTRTYPIARVVIAPRRLRSRAMLSGYRTAARLVRRFRRRAKGQ